MAVQLAPFTKSQWFDNAGNPLSGGKLFTFAAGTSTPLATFTDSTGVTPNANPVILDSAGRADVWMTVNLAYKLVLQNSAGSQLWSEDGINPGQVPASLGATNIGGALTIQQPTAATSGANQSSNIIEVDANYWNGSASALDKWTIQDVLGTGTNPTSTLALTHSGSPGAVTLNIPTAVTTTGTLTAATVISQKPLVNVLYFGADPTGAADSTTAVQNAINFAMSSGVNAPLYFPAGTYKITSAPTYTWTNCNELIVLGDGPQTSKISYTAAAGNLFTCTGTASQRKALSLRNIGLTATAATTAVALSYTAGEKSHIQNCQLTGFFGGIRITGTGNGGDGTAGNSFDILIKDVLINNYVAGGYAINVDHVVELHIGPGVELFAVGDADITSTAVIFDTGTNGVIMQGVDAVSGLHSFFFRNTNQGGAFGGVPSGFYMVNVLGDTPAGGDAWLFDSTLSANNVTLRATNCWARRAGIKGTGTTQTAGAIGINVAGGSDIHFTSSWVLECAKNGISVTSSGSDISFTDMNVQRNNFNNDNATTPGATVNASPTRVRFLGGIYNNLGGGNQNYGIDYSANASVTLFGVDADNNATGVVNPSSTSKVLVASAIASGDTFPSTDTASFLRLASNRYLSWRNAANSGNVSGLAKDGSDVFQLGDTAGVKTAGKMVSYNALTTAGLGLAAILGSTSQKSESAADTNVLTVTPAASAGSYRIRFTMAVSAQNTATLGWTATWKDSNGQAQAPTNLSLFTSGTAAPALTVTGATNGIYYGYIDIDVDNSATNIVVKLTFTGTSFTAKVSATVERLI